MIYTVFTTFVLLPYKITLLSNRCHSASQRSRVLLPYKITLLSNDRCALVCTSLVLLPYKITLLSNALITIICKSIVLLPYKITLLSNPFIGFSPINAKFYYPIKLHYSQTLQVRRKLFQCFTTL